MAIFHCSISNVSRASGGSACSALAYISGEKVFDERLNKTYNFGHKDRILFSDTIIPTFAPDKFNNPATLFNDIEKLESAINARTAKKIEVALPKELNLDEQKKCVENFIHDNLSANGFCAFFAIHDGGKNQNFHAHILVANRALDKNGQWSCKRKMAYSLDKNGNRIPILDKFGNQKTDSHGRKQWKRFSAFKNLLDDKHFLVQLRQNWATEVNKHLAPNLHIDHRSNADRGIVDTPTIHEGYAARAIEKKGGISERCQFNRDIKSDNSQLKNLHKDIAFKQTQLANLQSVPDSKSILLNAIAAALTQLSSGGGGLGDTSGSIFKKDYAELLKNASSPEEIAKILAEIEALYSEIHFSGGGLLLELQPDFDKERDLDERIKKLKQRRRTSGGFRISPERLRTTSSTESTTSIGFNCGSDSQSRYSDSDSDSSESTERDFVAELLAFRAEEEKRLLAESERRASQLSQEPRQSQKIERQFTNTTQPTPTPITEQQEPVDSSYRESQSTSAREQQTQRTTTTSSTSGKSKRPRNSSPQRKNSRFSR